MTISAAPIIHARTKDVDFRANLLVVPDDFSQQDVQWARKYIADSTRYFELAGNDGRRVVFSNDSFVVSGISIRIGDLYRMCGKQPQYDKVDGNRTNYAFIGLVFRRNQIKNPFDISHCEYLDIFEKYMDLRWSDSNSPEALLHTKAAYEDITLPKAAQISNVLPMSAGAHPQVVDIKADTLESITAQATMLAAQQPHFAFCSDIPMANCVLEGNFTVVTSPNAKSINESLNKRRETTGQPQPPNDTPKDSAKNKANKTEIEIFQDIASTQHDGNQAKKLSRKLVILCAAVGAIIVSLIVFALLNR